MGGGEGEEKKRVGIRGLRFWEDCGCLEGTEEEVKKLVGLDLPRWRRRMRGVDITLFGLWLKLRYY